jgi:hypothetical protein
MPHPHIQGLGKATAAAPLAPFVGVYLSYKLGTTGGPLGCLGAVLGLIPYLVAVLVGIAGIENAFQVATVPATHYPCPGVFCSLNGPAHLDTSKLFWPLVATLIAFWLITMVGFLIQWGFGRWSKSPYFAKEVNAK